MALLYSDLCNSPEQVVLRFRFQSAGGQPAAPDFLVPGNCGVTDVTQAATDGVFTITFAEKYPVFIGGHGAVMPATNANDQIVKIDVADYSPTAGTLIVHTIGALDTTQVAEAVAADDWVYLELTFCRRSGMAPTVAI